MVLPHDLSEASLCMPFSPSFGSTNPPYFVHVSQWRRWCLCQNDWYDREGTPTPLQSAGNEWEIIMDEHSLPDGLVHPVRDTSRRYCVNREGEGVWAPLKAEGPSGMLLAELFFRKGEDVCASERMTANGSSSARRMAQAIVTHSRM